MLPYSEKIKNKKYFYKNPKERSIFTIESCLKKNKRNFILIHSLFTKKSEIYSSDFLRKILLCMKDKINSFYPYTKSKQVQMCIIETFKERDEMN